MADIHWGQSVQRRRRGGVAVSLAVVFLASSGLLVIPSVRFNAAQIIASARVSMKGEGVYWRDPDFLEPGRVIASRDLAYLIREYQKTAFLLAADGRTGDADMMRATVEAMRDARRKSPQASLFECVEKDGMLELHPHDWQPAAIKQTLKSDVILIGGELSAIVTAVQAAEAGFTVALVHAGPLGGLSSDGGGNMRYFDYYPPTPRSNAQRRVFKEAFDGASWISIPSQTDARLRMWLQSKLSHKIKLVETRSYDSLTVETGMDSLNSITTAEGVKLTGRWYLDMDPESRVAEKAKVEMDLDTPHLSYGMVFDLENVQASDWQAMSDPAKVTTEKIMAWAGVTREQVEANPRALESMKTLRYSEQTEIYRVFPDFRYGYKALAEGYNFWMLCRELAGERSEAMTWLNEKRKVSGFNIAHNGSQATFNSISYRFRRSIMQHSHSLSRDAEFAPLRDLEIPSMTQYFRWVTGNSNVKVRMPEQFYVRKSTAFFMTKEPLGTFEENTSGKTGWFTCYAMDHRDLHARDETTSEIVGNYVAEARGVKRWPNRPSLSMTKEYKNLFLINKCSATPRYSGGMRIEQNQMNQGAAVVDYLKKQR